MFTNRSRRLNPVLETKRDGYLAAEKEKRDESLDSYSLLVSKTKKLHANLLFTTRHGRMILTAICRHVTFVDPNVINTSWKDLAAELGYDDVHVKCLSNLRGNTYDPTELILQYYAASKPDGTVGRILQVLLELGFLPALHNAQKHIDKFLAEVETGEIEIPLDTKELEAKKLVKAAHFKPFVPAIFDPLPLKEIKHEVVGYNNTIQQESFQQARPHTKQLKQYCKYVLLTFASDGHEIALEVAAILRSTTNRRGLPIGAVMLCENDNMVMENPGQTITELLSKMDFVIPVLTEGYFRALTHPDRRARLLDERYIQFIHDILVSKYIHNNCINTSVRPVIPSRAVSTICSKLEFVNTSIFQAWRSDDEIEVQTLANSIVKTRRRQVVVHQ